MDPKPRSPGSGSGAVWIEVDLTRIAVVVPCFRVGARVLPVLLDLGVDNIEAHVASLLAPLRDWVASLPTPR